MLTWTCPECNTEIREKRRRGPHLSGCRRAKAARYQYDDRKDPGHKHPLTTKACLCCGISFLARVPSTGYCSKACSQVGDHNSLWKGKGPAFIGSKAQYVHCHDTVRRMYGVPAYCAWAADGTCRGKFTWANVSGDYYNPEDFIRLCQSHNLRFDANKDQDVDTYIALVEVAKDLRDREVAA